MSSDASRPGTEDPKGAMPQTDNPLLDEIRRLSGDKSFYARDFRTDFAKLIKECGIFEDERFVAHIPRYLYTLGKLPKATDIRRGSDHRALEMGTSWFFPFALKKYYAYQHIDVTDFASTQSMPSAPLAVENGGVSVEGMSFKVDLESDPLPVSDDTYDMILCLEVVEHLELDPMFMIIEAARALRPGGVLFLSTPNSASGRNFFKIAKGFAPHFYMKYNKNREFYRHNIEYDVHQIKSLLVGAGLKPKRIWTEDCFESPVPRALELLEAAGLPTTNRGDNIFAVATKPEDWSVADRYPVSVYA